MWRNFQTKKKETLDHPAAIEGRSCFWKFLYILNFSILVFNKVQFYKTAATKNVSYRAASSALWNLNKKLKPLVFSAK